MSGRIKILIIAAAMLLLNDTTYPEAMKCVSGNCKNGSGSLVIPDEGMKYTGQFRNGKYHGKGTLIYDKYGYSEYTGEFRDGKEHGKGVLKNGFGKDFRWALTGTWENGMAVYGEYKFFNGDRYVGPILKDKMSGQGVFTKASGDRYEGEFSEGYMRGQGIWYYKNGTKYTGGVNEFGYHGKGTLYNADGSVKADGNWSKGVFIKQTGNTTSGSSSVSFNPNSYTEQAVNLSELPEWKWQYADGQGKYYYLIHQEKCAYGLELEQWYQDRGFVSTQHNQSSFCGKKMPPGYQVFVKPVLFIWGKQWTAAEIAERKQRIEEAKNSSAAPKKGKDYKGTYGWETCVKNCWNSYKIKAGQDACVKSCETQYAK